MLLCKFSFLVLSHFGSLWSVMSIHLPANQIIIRWKILSVCHSNLCWAVVHCNPVLYESEYKIIPDPGLVLHGAVNVLLFFFLYIQKSRVELSEVLRCLRHLVGIPVSAFSAHWSDVSRCVFSLMAFWQNSKGWQNSSSLLLLSHQVKICSMATTSMLANMLLGLQRGTPAQDTGARVYRDRMSHWQGLWLESCLSQRGSSEDVGDTVTPYRKAALHLWDHQLNVLDGVSLHPSGRQPEGWVHAWWNSLVFFPPLLQSTIFGLFLLVKRNLSFLSFLSWQVP